MCSRKFRCRQIYVGINKLIRDEFAPTLEKLVKKITFQKFIEFRIFFIRAFFQGHWRFAAQQGKEGDHLGNKLQNVSRKL